VSTANEREVSTANEREMYEVGFKTLAYLGVGTHWQRRVSFTVSKQGLAELVH